MIKKILDKIRSWFNKSPVPYEPLHIANVMPPKPITTIRVYVGDKLIGAVQSLTISESRSINEPSTTSVNLVAHRVRFDKQRAAEAFEKGSVHVAAQIYPLQIEIDDDEATTTIKNAWITSIDESYLTNDWVIMNAAELEAEKISSKVK